MNLTNPITMRVIIPSALLVCLSLTSLAYGFDVRFASGKSAFAIPFELENNHIFLRIEETAEVLAVSPGTVMRDWTLAKAWFKRAMTADSSTTD
jgi:hypothetical protein